MAAATTYTLTKPTADVIAVGQESDNFTLTPDGDTTDVWTPDDEGKGGTFTPTTITFANTTPKTFTYTPASAGPIAISGTNDGDLIDAAAVTINGQTPVTWPTEYGNADMAIPPAAPKIIVDGEAVDVSEE